MGPGITLQRPLIARMVLVQFFGDFTEDGVIVRRFVVTHSAPVDGFRGHRRVSIIFSHAGVNVFRVGPFLVHKGDPSQSHFQTRAKPILWQITLDAIAFDSVWIHDQNRRRPKRVEALKPGGMFFNMRFERNESLIDEVRDLFI